MSHIKMLIHFEHTDVMQPVPWAVAIDHEHMVTSGLGHEDGAFLVGFGPKDEQRITVLLEDAQENPETVVGLVPTFTRNGKLFVWNLAVTRLEVRA